MLTLDETKQTEKKETQVSYSQMLSVIKNDQHIGYAFVGGMLGMLLAMSLWAFLTALLSMQIGYMAIGAGLLVAWFVRIMGRGVGLPFALIGAFFALMSCLLGNLLSEIIMATITDTLSIRYILGVLSWQMVFDIYAEMFSPIDLLFYAIASYEGFYFACPPVEKTYAGIKQKESQHLPVTYPWRIPLTLFTTAVTVIALYFLIVYTSKLTFYYESGVKQAEGKIKNGEYDGKWYYWNEAGELDHIGYYENGLTTGEWVHYYTDGKIQAIGHYVDGLEEGAWNTYHENGRLADSVNYENGRKEGKYYVWDEEGQLLLRGEYDSDFCVGHWVVYYPSGQIKEEGDMEADQRIDIWRTYFEDGSLNKEIEYLENEKEKFLNVWDAEHKKIIADGNGWYQSKNSEGVVLEEGQVKNGFPVGIWKKYNASGQLQEIGEYKGERYFIQKVWNPQGECIVDQGNGEYEAYNDEGILYHTGTLRNGLFHGKMKIYYPTGEIYTENEMYEGTPHGWQKVYYMTGDLQAEGKMIEGERDSIWCTYHPAGSIHTKVNYIHGKKEGKQTFFDESGRLLKEENYIRGQEVKGRAIVYPTQQNK